MQRHHRIYPRPTEIWVSKKGVCWRVVDTGDRLKKQTVRRVLLECVGCTPECRRVKAPMPAIGFQESMTLATFLRNYREATTVEAEVARRTKPDPLAVYARMLEQWIHEFTLELRMITREPLSAGLSPKLSLVEAQTKALSALARIARVDGHKVPAIIACTPETLRRLRERANLEPE